MDTLLIHQTPSRTTRDETIALLEKLTSAPRDGGWGNRLWKRLHFKILDVGDEFADLFPRLLPIFPVSLPHFHLSPFLHSHIDLDLDHVFDHV